MQSRLDSILRQKIPQTHHPNLQVYKLINLFPLLRLGLLSGFPPLLLEGGLRSALVLPPLLWATVVLPSFSLTIVISLKRDRLLMNNYNTTKSH